MKSLIKKYCQYIYHDEDGWWAKLKAGYFYGCDNNTIVNGETFKQLCEELKEVHK